MQTIAAGRELNTAVLRHMIVSVALLGQLVIHLVHNVEVLEILVPVTVISSKPVHTEGAYHAAVSAKRPVELMIVPILSAISPADVTGWSQLRLPPQLLPPAQPRSQLPLPKMQAVRGGAPMQGIPARHMDYPEQVVPAVTADNVADKTMWYKAAVPDAVIQPLLTP